MKPLRYSRVILALFSIAMSLVGCKDANVQKSVSQPAVADTASSQPSSGVPEAAPQAAPEPPPVADIKFLELFAMSQGADGGFRVNGYPVTGQRFRFRACVQRDLFLYESFNSEVGGCDGQSIVGVAEFDNEQQHQMLSREPEGMRTVIASTGYNKYDSTLHIHSAK